MTVATPDLILEHNAPLPTWFKVGGRADRLARPASTEDLRRCLEIDPALRVLGDGANLLVDDDGVTNLVIAFTHPDMTRVRRDEATGLTIARAGASLFKMIPECVRLGLSGLERLAGIPATIGGATVMNAGGKFGEIADLIVRVHALNRDGRQVTLERRDIPFSYRHSGLTHLIITEVELNLTPDDPATLRARFKEVMEYKKSTQPMDANSAGCAFKNPTLKHDLKDIAPANTRVSAGMLIDRAGCKGLRQGSAEVSHRHGNFLFAHNHGSARDVIDLIRTVQRRVHDTFGVHLDTEVVIWSRHPEVHPEIHP